MEDAHVYQINILAITPDMLTQTTLFNKTTFLICPDGKHIISIDSDHRCIGAVLINKTAAFANKRFIII
jgi:hypothetical protein